MTLICRASKLSSSKKCGGSTPNQRGESSLAERLYRADPKPTRCSASPGKAEITLVSRLISLKPKVVRCVKHDRPVYAPHGEKGRDAGL